MNHRNIITFIEVTNYVYIYLFIQDCRELKKIIFLYGIS